MQSAFGVVHPDPVRKSAPKLTKLSKSLVTGLFRGGAASVKGANAGAKGVRAGAPVLSEAENASYKAAQLNRMKQSQTGGKQVALRPKAGLPVPIRAPKPQLAIEGPKAGAPRNLPSVRQKPVQVPNRAVARVDKPAGSGELVPTRSVSAGPSGASAGPSAGASGAKSKKARSNPFAGAGEKIRGKFKPVQKPATASPTRRATNKVTVSPLAATAIGAGVAGGGYLAGQGIRAGLAERKQKARAKP
jgi:hypothetical protein